MDMSDAPSKLADAIHRLNRFVEGETARTIYRLPPNGRFDPMRDDVAALIRAAQSSNAST